jgi:hypothetical protein
MMPLQSFQFVRQLIIACERCDQPQQQKVTSVQYVLIGPWYSKINVCHSAVLRRKAGIWRLTSWVSLTNRAIPGHIPVPDSKLLVSFVLYCMIDPFDTVALLGNHSITIRSLDKGRSGCIVQYFWRIGHNVKRGSLVGSGKLEML